MLIAGRKSLAGVLLVQCTRVFTGDYKCLGEVNILVTPLLPRIQGYNYIFIRGEPEQAPNTRSTGNSFIKGA